MMRDALRGAEADHEIAASVAMMGARSGQAGSGASAYAPQLKGRQGRIGSKDDHNGAFVLFLIWIF
jgi:hypothetical protein